MSATARTPAERLCLALLDRAVKDLHLHDPHAHEAWEWLFAEAEAVLPFRACCAILGLVPERVREGLAARGLAREPPRYPPKPRAREKGVGRGGWVLVDPARHCVICRAVFTALKPDTQYCFACHRVRYPWKKRKAA